MENHHFKWKTHYRLPFSIAILNYQRVHQQSRYKSSSSLPRCGSVSWKSAAQRILGRRSRGSSGWPQNGAENHGKILGKWGPTVM